MIPVIFVLTASAMPMARRLKLEIEKLEQMPCEIHAPHSVAGHDFGFEKASGHLQQIFSDGRMIVGLCASGILIRSLAPILASKLNDPPVISVAEDGSSVVPLLGGHHGANQLARRIASLIGGHAAITTAGDVSLGLSLDEPPPGYWLENRVDAKSFTTWLLSGELVNVVGDAPWLSSLQQSDAASKTIVVTESLIEGNDNTLVFHPETLAVGLGCERGTDPGELLQLVHETLERYQLSEKSIACFATIDIKEDEPAIRHVSRLPVRYFSTQQLAPYAAIVPNPSKIVEDEIGISSVCEAAALAAAGEGGRLIVTKTKSKRATCAIARSPNMIQELRGRPAGKLSVVGIGPGQRSFQSGASSAALNVATDWVGYDLYLDLIQKQKYGQVEHRFPLGAEEDRVRHAIGLTKEGKHVALVCSGDAGIYAMAALVFEIIDLEPCRIAVEVIPGISAFQAAAASAGAMIGHDFCCISLSDLLTPWEVIEKRIAAAAEGDFVVSFYNPRSLKRRDQLERAMAILSAHRPTDTPVVIASSLGRPEEKLKIVPLSSFDPKDVDMLTLVMVGSSQSKSFKRGDGRTYAYTPRGYAKKRGKA